MTPSLSDFVDKEVILYFAGGDKMLSGKCIAIDSHGLFLSQDEKPPGYFPMSAIRIVSVKKEK